MIKNVIAPLMMATRQNNAKIVRKLLKAGATVKSGQDEPELIIAKRQGSDQIVRDLIKFGKADVNTRGADGRTALIVALEEGQTKCVEILIKGGANVNLTAAPSGGNEQGAKVNLPAASNFSREQGANVNLAAGDWNTQ